MPRPKKPAQPPPKKLVHAKAKAPRLATPVEIVRHKDKRANIPTEELRHFVADDEKAPKTVLYPRDPSLDPPTTGKIAVKVINHYGDEVMKVYEVSEGEA